jgi:protein subunit release factor B
MLERMYPTYCERRDYGLKCLERDPLGRVAGIKVLSKYLVAMHVAALRTESGVHRLSTKISI